MAHLCSDAVAVIGEHLDDHGHIPRAIPFIGDLLVIDRIALPRRLFDRTGDVVVWHVVGLGLGDHVAQLAVVGRVSPALLDGNGDLTADLGEYLAALRVGLFLLFLMFAHLECPDITSSFVF